MNVQSIVDAIQSHALATGAFEHVNAHEPKRAPGSNLHAAVWVQEMSPCPGVSGLSLTAVRLEFNVRVYTSMLAEPQDAIDPQVMDAVDALMAAYHSDLTFDGLIHAIDVFGAYGNKIKATAGYINQDGKLFRVMTITLPVVVADVWNQVA